jgi:hypothetical protein
MPFGRLVGISRRAHHNLLACPSRPGKLCPENLSYIDLDPDHSAVFLARRPVSSLLERPDIAEAASVLTAHIGIE